MCSIAALHSAVIALLFTSMVIWFVCSYTSGAHFIEDFIIAIKIRPKFYLGVEHIFIEWLLWVLYMTW